MSGGLSPQPQGTVVSARPNLLKPWSPQTQKGSQEKGASASQGSEAGSGWTGRSPAHPWAVYLAFLFISTNVWWGGAGQTDLSLQRAPPSASWLIAKCRRVKHTVTNPSKIDTGR